MLFEMNGMRTVDPGPVAGGMRAHEHGVGRELFMRGLENLCLILWRASEYYRSCTEADVLAMYLWATQYKSTLALIWYAWLHQVSPLGDPASTG